MAVSYGFGVAWNVLPPESFRNISLEVLSLYDFLKEAEETVFKSPLPPQSQARLKTVGDVCRSVLGDLKDLVNKHQSLAT